MAIEEAEVTIAAQNSQIALLEQQVDSWQEMYERELEAKRMWRNHADEISGNVKKEKVKSLITGAGIGIVVTFGFSWLAQIK